MRAQPLIEAAFRINYSGPEHCKEILTLGQNIDMHRGDILPVIQSFKIPAFIWIYQSF